MGIEIPAQNALLDMSGKDYFSLPYVNQSYLKRFLKSPFHAKHDYHGAPTAAQIMGTQFETLLLEPNEFSQRYISAPTYEFDGRKAEGKAERAAFQVLAEGREIINPDDQAILLEMFKATHADKTAQQLFNDGHAQPVLIWEDELGFWCKARLDWLPAAISNLIVDVKTTRCADPKELQRDVLKYGYHLQEAFYRRGWSHIFGNVPDFVFSFHEKPKSADEKAVPPVIIELTREWRAVAEREIVKLMELHKQYRDKPDEEWVGYTSGGIIALSPPTWFREE